MESDYDDPADDEGEAFDRWHDEQKDRALDDAARELSNQPRTEE